VGRTDDDGDGDVFLFVATGETSADFVQYELLGTTSRTLSLTLMSLVHCIINLTSGQVVRWRTTVLVDDVVRKVRIFHALQREAVWLVGGDRVQRVEVQCPAKGKAPAYFRGGGARSNTVCGNGDKRWGGGEGGGAAAEGGNAQGHGLDKFIVAGRCQRPW
jgi:hypothetical protein